MNPFASISVAQLTAWRDDALVAYNKLITGRQSVEVVADGYVVRYTRADSDTLLAYINQLKAAIEGKHVVGAVGMVF